MLVMPVLRDYLSDAHVRALAGSGLLDREINDPRWNERFHLIARQLMAALVIHSILEEFGVATPNTVDLLPLLQLAQTAAAGERIWGRRVEAILREFTTDANLAKHRRVFRSRL